jgi:hypothetical protein
MPNALALLLASSQTVREWIIAISAALAALGTLSAVLVALFGASFRNWRRRPLLSLSFQPVDQTTAGFYRAIRPDDGQLHDAAFARLRVSNHGRSVADEVEVLVEKVGLRAVEEPASPDPGPLAGIKAILALDSLADLPLAASNVSPSASRFTLPQKTDRHVDLALLFKSDGERHGPLVLCTAPNPPDSRHVLDPGVDAIELHLIVTARNADPTRFRLWLKRFQGEWPLHASEIWHEISVEPLR